MSDPAIETTIVLSVPATPVSDAGSEKLHAAWQRIVTSHSGEAVGLAAGCWSAAFSDPGNALQAAASVQDLAADHAGTAAGGFGAGLHRCLAIRSGDQIRPATRRRGGALSRAAPKATTLLDEPTARHLQPHLPTGAALLPVGEHRLSDLGPAAALFAYDLSGELDQLPGLGTPGAALRDLPLQQTPLVGRDTELDDLAGLLSRTDVRLVTMTGAGGAGKTRLALQLAADLATTFADGVLFVSLAPVSDPGLVAASIAEQLHVPDYSSESHQAVLSRYLRDKHLLLVLDNFEQVIEAAPLATVLLQQCPRLKLLVTSRETLRLTDEHHYRVPPLQVPAATELLAAGADLMRSMLDREAVWLFIERACAVQPGFGLTADNAPAIAQLCHRLDGLPLAIELAAARIGLVTPQVMLQRLRGNLPVLATGPRDVPEHQQTLEGTIAWSYELLEEQEQILLRRLAVFVGGCTLDAAEAVCNATSAESGNAAVVGRPLDVLEGMASLCAKSLLLDQSHAGEEPRFLMLETVRAFAHARLLHSGEHDAMRAAHAAHVARVIEVAAPNLRAAGQVEWALRLRAELGNIRAALSDLRQRGELERMLYLAAQLRWFWFFAGLLTEGRGWISAVDRAGDAVTPETRAEAYATAVMFAAAQSDDAAVAPLGDDGMALAQQIGADHAAAIIATFRGVSLYLRGDFTDADDQYQLALAHARRLDSRQAEAEVYRLSGLNRRQLGAHDEAVDLIERALTMSRAIGDTTGIAMALRNRALVAIYAGDYAGAEELVKESAELSAQLVDRWSLAWCLEQFSVLALHLHRAPARCAMLFAAASSMRSQLDVIIPESDRALFAASQQTARAELGEDRYLALTAEGARMSVEAAIEYALDEGGTDAVSPRANNPGGLSRREVEVLALLAAGHTNKEIGERLFISGKTAANHVSRILEKLAVSNRAEAAVFAAQHGLVVDAHPPS